LPQEFPSAQLIVQPRNRGTACGVLLQLLHVREVDPDAAVLLLPCDHFALEEAVLQSAMQQAVQRVRAAPQQIVLLGMSPEVPDSGLGYIMPEGREEAGIRAVSAFVEKPDLATAATLIEHGALLNTFILAARCTALLELYARTQPELFESMLRVMETRCDRQLALAALYDRLPMVDFSSQVLAPGRAPELQVLAVPECGWSDLGTPERLGQTLLKFKNDSWHAARLAASVAAPIDLADHYWQAQGRPMLGRRVRAGRPPPVLC